MNFVFIRGCSSLAGQASKTGLVFSGLVNKFSGGFSRRGYISSVKAACSGSYKFSYHYCSLAIHGKVYPKSRLYKVMEVEKGPNSIPLMSRRNYTKKRTEAETQDEEELGHVKEGDIINLQDLIFVETRDYLVKYNGQKVPVSQYAGKRLIIYFEMHKYYNHWNKLRMLKDLYLKMKGTDDEFEVIYIKDPSSYNMPDVHWLVHDYGELPWRVHYYGEGYSLPEDLEHSVLNYYYYPHKRLQYCLLIAFDRDGSIVRKTFYPTFDDTEFPFYDGGLEQEFWSQLSLYFDGYYWDDLSEKKNPIYKRAQLQLS